MKDVQKIKEFFSNPVKESTSLDNEAKVYWMQQLKKGKIDTLPEDPKAAYMKIKMKKPLKEESDLFKINTDLAFKIFDFLKTKLGEDFTSEFPIKSNFFFQLNDYLKGMNEAMTTAYEAKKEDVVKFKKGDTVFDKHTKAKLKVTRVIKDKIYTVPFNFPGRAEEWYKAEDLQTKSFFQEQKEDPVDTITMDIPLFLRMLEYAREDASQDLDLHDVTEKANKLGKERGILQMDDYDEIVGDTKDSLKEIIKKTLKKKGISPKK